MSTAYAPQRPAANTAMLSPEQEQAQRSEKLLRMLKMEEWEALGYAQSEVTGQQIDALKRYYGEPYGDEEDGRSKVVTREVFETIEWTRPDLMRVFASGSNIIYLEESSEADSKYAKDAADYLSWIFFSDNPGYENLDDFAFDGLLHRRGFMACYWRDAEHRAPQTLTGLNIMQVQELMADPSVEIIGQDFDGESEVGGIALRVRRTKSPARAEIVTIAPEDMRLNGRAVHIDDARYVGRVIRMLRGEVQKMWPDHAQEIAMWSGAGGAASANANIRRSNDVRQWRFKDDENVLHSSSQLGESSEVEVLEEYLRVDLDGDGYPELIRSYRCGDCLLEAEEVEENPFWSWTPIRVPHRFYGLGVDDEVADLQKRATVLTRAALDATYQSVVNREAYDETKVNLEDLLATYTGAKVAVKGPPGESIFPLTGGIDTASVAWTALLQGKLTLADRTGAGRESQGTDPDALLKGPHSGKAIDLLQTAGAARKETMARNMGAGLDAGFGKLYRLVCRNQNAPRQAKVGGKLCTFDPRTWNSDLRVRVHTGLGTGNRDQTMLGLQVISQFQEAVIDKLGPSNPLVTPEHVHRSFEEMCRTLGYRSADGFMSEPPDVPVPPGPDGHPVLDEQTGQPKTQKWTPEPQPDPKMAEVQSRAQLAAQKQQQDAEAASASHQLEGLKAAAGLELQQKKDEESLQAQREKAALDIRLAEEKAAAEIQLAREKAQAEIDLADRKMTMEFALAEKKMALEAALEREKIEASREMHSEKTEASTEMHSEKVAADVQISKNRPGGDLSE